MLLVPSDVLSMNDTKLVRAASQLFDDSADHERQHD